MSSTSTSQLSTSEQSDYAHQLQGTWTPLQKTMVGASAILAIGLTIYFIARNPSISGGDGGSR